jgi:hypothetical protein
MAAAMMSSAALALANSASPFHPYERASLKAAAHTSVVLNFSAARSASLDSSSAVSKSRQ